MWRIPFLVLLLLPFSCSNEKLAGQTSSIHAFYYWQTSMGAFNWDDSLYRSMHISKIYCRFFDVSWSTEAKAPVPVSPLDVSYRSGWQSGTELVPVIFITNETFKNLNQEQSAELARQVHKKVMAQLNVWLMSEFTYSIYDTDWWQQDPYQIKSRTFNEQDKHDSLYVAKMKTIREIQFDCDWTNRTKNQYFAFLEEAKKVFKDQTISSTVRLYQYKYPQKAGLPPVKRGMLMCYNAGDVKDAKTRNSIFDKREIMSYLVGSEYPIPLDYALPIFQWALLYHNNELKSILPVGFILEEYKSYVRPKGEHHLEVTDDFVFGYSANSIYLRKGDEIRLEVPDMEEVQEVAAWLNLHKNNKEAVLSLYQLNRNDLKKHSKAIDAIFTSF